MLASFQSAISDIEAEIRIIESKLAEETAVLEQYNKTEEEYSGYVHSLEATRAIIDEYNCVRPVATNSQRDYNSLKGIHSWCPIEISESRISLMSLGLSNQTCNKMTYEVSKSMTTSVAFSRQPADDATKGSLRRYNGLLANFIERNVDRLADGVAGGGTFSAVHVSQNVQNILCCMGRLDIIAVELQGLVDRHGGRLARNSIDSLSLSLEFEGPTSKIGVHFMIGPSYPWLPLEVELDVFEGFIDMDVDRIYKALKKHTRLGFGSLSRACDIVKAFVSK